MRLEMVEFGEEKNSKGSGGYADLGGCSRWASSRPPDLESTAVECLSAAEESTAQVLNCVHPTLDSEEKRRDVIDYIQQLVKSRLHCEVAAYGSVPLKTYLPDGDIDLTVLKGPNVEDSLVYDVLAVIQDEERNENAEYEVRETQFIDAEVKLVKCLVRNIVIDISCNQLGGLSTLCFLEQVDRFIGRNHLFKRSIILIKSWCYYESRILGAHHGLISTYALETLVLYIFHFFHSSLSGPLSVLHRFLDYYSKFDWENYCISLKGPVRRSSLPDNKVVMPNTQSNSLLLSEEFLESCVEMFSTPCRGLEGNSKPFQIKHLNIMDPLKENNNLGRSVNKGNFYRIRSALKYGACKFGRILSLSREEVVDEIRSFFTNTYERHEHQLKGVSLDAGDEESLTASISSSAVVSSEDDTLSKSYGCDHDNHSIYYEPSPISGLTSKLESSAVRENPVETTSESCSWGEGVSVSGRCIAKNKSGVKTSNSSSWSGIPDNLSSGSHSVCPSENQFCGTAGSVENGSSDSQQVDSEKFHFNSWLENRYTNRDSNNSLGCCEDYSDAAYTTTSSYVTKHLEEDNFDSRETESLNFDDESEVLDGVADLTGDYDSHIRSLLHGQLCHGFAKSSPPYSRTEVKKPWDILGQSTLLRPNSFPPMNSRSVSSDPKENHIRVKDPAVYDFQFEWQHKSQGIGTYFPKMNIIYSSHGRGRNRNSFYHPSPESTSSENVQLKVQSRFRRQRHNKSPSSASETNGYLRESCRIEFGSLGNLGEEALALQKTTDGSSTSVSVKERQSIQIHLTEDEFPPLAPIISKACLPCIRS